MKINIIRTIIILLLLGTLTVIFNFSNQDAEKSSSVSREFSKTVVNIVNKKDSKQIKEQKIKKTEPVIRKLAHFSIYMVVGFLMMCLMYTYKIQTKNKIIISLIVGFVYACSDEIHQLFIARKKWGI